MNEQQPSTVDSRHSLHTMPFSATLIDLHDGGGVRFALWAPGAARVWLERGAGTAALPAELAADLAHLMVRDADGWHRIVLAEARAGDRYRYRLPSGLRVPDPASRFNPDDIHGASQVIDPRAYSWHDADWRGRAWEEAVIYELHIGTFTLAGTFDAARERLTALVALGITAVELMPLADFAGQRGWGYDGVLLYAPDASYGTPDQLKALVDAAHGLGLMVLIDVVYNHFGPEGNYLHTYCPQFFNAQHPTPWGAAINYDADRSRMVRDFFVHNALYWVEEYHFDGLRMDAIHAIRDDSQPDIVLEVCRALREGPGRSRAVHVVLENELNQASLLQRNDDLTAQAGSAQWNDDLHHAAHVLVTGESDGYYGDYADAPVERFGRALAEGFDYQGQPSPLRHGAPRGEPSAHLPLNAFVSFLQSHDQVGNRAFGERIGQLANPVLLRAAYACVLLSPHVPMLFMGEEYAASTPFHYFCNFDTELATAVSRGRREEFGHFRSFGGFAGRAARARLPDPNAKSTFDASKLRWEERNQSPHREWLAYITALLALRRQWLVPHLAGPRHAGAFWRDGDVLRVEWKLGGGDPHAPTDAGIQQDRAPRLHLLAYFGKPPLGDVMAPPGAVVYAHGVEIDGERLRLTTGSVRVTLQEYMDG